MSTLTQTNTELNELSINLSKDVFSYFAINSSLYDKQKSLTKLVTLLEKAFRSQYQAIKVHFLGSLQPSEVYLEDDNSERVWANDYFYFYHDAFIVRTILNREEWLISHL